MFSTWGTFLVLGSWLTEYFLKGQGQVFWASATLSGVAVLLGALGRALGGALTPRGWERRFIGGAFLLSGGAALGLASSSSLLPSAALATSAIVASSFVFAPVLRLTALLTDVRAMGTAFGLILFLGTLLTSLFPPAFGHLLDLTGQFDKSLILMAVIPFIGATAILFVREGPAPSPPWPLVEAGKVL
jgi:nitrate/nitrite transporter NarK